MKWPWCQARREREERAAAERMAAAEREVETSRRRLREAHEHVVKPLRDYADANHFSQLVRDSLRP